MTEAEAKEELGLQLERLINLQFSLEKNLYPPPIAITAAATILEDAVFILRDVNRTLTGEDPWSGHPDMPELPAEPAAE